MKITKEKLDDLARRYETPEFITNDPVQFPRRYASKQDIEIAGLLTAIIAWGNRKQIINDCNKMFFMIGKSPFRFVIDCDWDNIDPNINIHRTFFGRDLIYICRGLKYIYHRAFSLENIKYDNVWQWIERLQYLMVEANSGEYNKHIAPSGGNHSSHKGKSACKRLHLFLRWMVRTGSPVDLGIWTHNFTPRVLLIPLDTHVARVGREMGLITHKSNDRIAVEELTDKLRDFDIDDPCKYDFALFGFGESLKTNGNERSVLFPTRLQRPE